VTFNLCTTSGLLVEHSNFVGKLFLPVNSSKFKSDSSGHFEFFFLLSVFLCPAKRTSSPNSSCRSLIIAFFTSKSVTTLLTPKTINTSSFTECSATINQSNVNMKVGFWILTPFSQFTYILNLTYTLC
jgi:hypothetical protein